MKLLTFASALRILKERGLSLSKPIITHEGAKLVIVELKDLDNVKLQKIQIKRIDYSTGVVKIVELLPGGRATDWNVCFDPTSRVEM